jgi:putative ATPase
VPQNHRGVLWAGAYNRKGKLLYRMIKLTDIVNYNCTALRNRENFAGRIIARTTKSSFEKLNAVTAGVTDIKRIVADTQNQLLNPSGKTVLFIDEIHRFNKAQQTLFFLSWRTATIVLIGATTENPFFEVNKALISRSSVFMLKPLSEEDIIKIVKAALKDRKEGLETMSLILTRMP